MDGIYDLDMAFDMSEYMNASSISETGGPETKSSESWRMEESEDIYKKIMLMPTLQIADQEDDTTTMCTICMEGFRSTCSSSGTEGKRISCGHVYHVNCIAKWLSLYNSCPLCRSTVSGHRNKFSSGD